MIQHVPRVSIGMPVYNGEKYLSTAVDSLLAQTFEDFELVISDNASTDRTEEMCRDYAARDPRIRYFREESNRGVAWNFCHVVGLSRGEYFKWAAHDDVCEPTFLARCVDVLDRHPDVVWCHPQTAYVDARGRRMTGPGEGVVSFAVAPGRPAEKVAGIGGGDPSQPTRESASPHRRFRAVLLGPGEVHDVYGLIRMSAMRQTGLERPFHGSDKVFIAELSLLGRFVEVREVLFYSRRHAEQFVFLPSARILEAETSGRRRWLVVPRRLRCMFWYLLLILKGRIIWYERLPCLTAWVHFVCRPKKWKRLAVDGLRLLGLKVPSPEDAVRPALTGQSPARAPKGSTT